MTVKNNLGIEIPIGNIASGTLHATATFEDYGIKAGHDYKVHNAEDTGAYIFANGTVRLWNNEVRPDVWAALIWTK